MLVSLCIIAFNEEKNINGLLNSVVAQTYPHDKTEIIFVDGMSSDKTKKLMEEFRDSYTSDYVAIKIVNNVKRVQPCGLNLAIKNSEGDVIIRIDAHAILNKDFVLNNVKCIETGEDVCGGYLKKVARGSELMLMAETSMFGGSVADYRCGTVKKYVKTVANACYRREVFEKVGLFNEKLMRSEDNEMHYRIRKAGYNICYSSDIRSEYITRPTLKGMLKQKFGNGKYVGLTTKISPKVFSVYHYVPCVFVLCAILATVLFALSFCLKNFYLALPFICGAGLYLICDILLSLKTCLKGGKIKYFLPLVVIYPLLHFSYGTGTITGLIKMPFFKCKRIKTIN